MMSAVMYVTTNANHAESQVNSEKRDTVISSRQQYTEGRIQSLTRVSMNRVNKNFSIDAKSTEEKKAKWWIGDNGVGRKELNDIKDNLQKKFDRGDRRGIMKHSRSGKDAAYILDNFNSS